MIPGYLTVKDAARFLDIDPSLVTRYLRDGRLRGQKIGKMWFIRQQDIEEFALIPRRRGNPLLQRRWRRRD